MSATADVSGLEQRIAQFQEKLKPEWRDLARFVALLIRRYIGEQFDKSPRAAGTFNTGPRLHRGSGSLADSFTPGEPYNYFSVDITAERVQIVDGSDHPAARIHEHGGKIPITKKVIAFYWARFIETRLPYWKILALSALKKTAKNKKGFIRMKPRSYVGRAETALATEGLDQIALEVTAVISRTWNALS